MTLLSFERRYRLDGPTCESCSGSGIFPRAMRGQSRECWNCRGLGRRLTPAARRLFSAVCDLLGTPVVMRESRIWPKHLDQIQGSRVRAGMVVSTLERPPKFRTVARVDILNASQSRLVFSDRSALAVDTLTTLRRRLAPSELSAVDALLATRLGNGAIEAQRLLPRAKPKRRARTSRRSARA